MAKVKPTPEPNIEFSLTEVRNRTYKLKPFGHFKIKWSPSYLLGKRNDIIPSNELSSEYDNGMPCDGKIDKNIVKFMIAHKTDILTNGNEFFTRFGKGFVEVQHHKFNRYAEFLRQWDYPEHCEEAWKNYMQ